MRAKAIAGVLALGVALLAAPSGASAGEKAVRFPGYVSTSMFVRGTHGYFFLIGSLGHEDFLVAQQLDPESGGDSFVSYTRLASPHAAGSLHFGLGRAGEVDLRLVVEKVREEEPSKGCTGGPTVAEAGHFVGTISFHPPGGFTELHSHRAVGSLIRRPSATCHSHLFRRGEAAIRRQAERIRRLIAGDPDGRRRFEVGTYPKFSPDEAAVPSFSASVTREEGPVTITESASASSSSTSATFAVPDLEALPATVTVEPAAPFSGSATFELPSRRTATFSGDLAVELPEGGKVPLTGPKIAAGVCRGFRCTKSLPKALRPQSRSSGFIVSSVAGGRSEVAPARSKATPGRSGDLAILPSERLLPRARSRP